MREPGAKLHAPRREACRDLGRDPRCGRDLARAARRVRERRPGRSRMHGPLDRQRAQHRIHDLVDDRSDADRVAVGRPLRNDRVHEPGLRWNARRLQSRRRRHPHARVVQPQRGRLRAAGPRDHPVRGRPDALFLDRLGARRHDLAPAARLDARSRSDGSAQRDETRTGRRRPSRDSHPRRPRAPPTPSTSRILFSRRPLARRVDGGCSSACAVSGARSCRAATHALLCVAGIAVMAARRRRRHGRCTREAWRSPWQPRGQYATSGVHSARSRATEATRPLRRGRSRHAKPRGLAASRRRLRGDGVLRRRPVARLRARADRRPTTVGRAQA